MLDLYQLPLLRNAEIIIKELNQYQNDKKMIEGRDTLAAALKKGDMSAPILKDSKLPHYALLAYQHEKISEAQLVSMLLLWSAQADYPDNKMSKMQIHQLSAEDHNTQNIFKKYLKLQHFQTGLFNTSTIDDDLDEEVKNKIIRGILNDNAPLSEQYFFTFEIKQNEENAAIFNALQEIGFDLFVPQELHNGKYRAIIPSLTMIQTTLEHLVSNPQKLIARIGEDSFDDVYKMHIEDYHPFGLSYPGFEKVEADGLKCGRFGFAIHDIYHVTLLAFTPHKELFKELVQIGKKIHENKDGLKQKHFQEAVDSIIDNEFRQYTGNIQKNSAAFTEKELLSSKEMAVINAFLSILAKTVLYTDQINQLYKLLEEENINEKHSLNTIESIKASIEKFEKLVDKKALEHKLEFCQLFINELYSEEVLKQQQINLANFLRCLDLLENLLQGNRGIFGFTPSEEAAKQSIEMIKIQFNKFFDSEANKKNNPWLKAYYEYRDALKDCVINNNSEKLDSILTEKAYLKYIPDLNNIQGENTPLLEQAIKLGYLEIVKRLHGAGTALHPSHLIIAIKNKDFPMLDYLLSVGVDPYYLDSEKLSAIDYCLESGWIDGLKLMLDYVSLGQRHLEYLEHKGIKIHHECRNLLKRYNAFKDCLYEIYYKNDKHERSALLQKLIDNNSDNFSYTTQLEFKKLNSLQPADNPEHYQEADAYMHSSFLSTVTCKDEFALLSKHQIINVNKKNSKGNTVLLQSLVDDTCKAAKLDCLVELGADINAVNKEGKSPLFQSLKTGRFDIAKKLLNNGAALNISRDYKLYLEMVMQWVSFRGFDHCLKELMAILLEHGLDINKKNLMQLSSGFFSLNDHILSISLWGMMRDQPTRAFFSSHSIDMPLEYRIFFIKHGADPNEKSYEGNIELHSAIQKDWEEYVLLLLKHKADPNLINNDGESALHIAARKGDEKTMKLLREYGAKSFPNKYNETPEQILASKLATHVVNVGMFKITSNNADSLNTKENYQMKFQ